MILCQVLSPFYFEFMGESLPSSTLLLLLSVQFASSLFPLLKGHAYLSWKLQVYLSMYDLLMNSRR